MESNLLIFQKLIQTKETIPGFSEENTGNIQFEHYYNYIFICFNFYNTLKKLSKFIAKIKIYKFLI